jgi:CheY-like chemotaxis protein
VPDSAQSRSSPSPLRILLIDDDAISREVLQMTMEMHGFAVETAEDGASALMLLGIVEADVILMDTQMPGISGVELISALQMLSQARIIAISGSDPGVAIRNAADGFLLKPIEPEHLSELLASEQTGTESALPDRPPTGAVEPIDPAVSPVDPIDPIDPVVLGKLTAMMPDSAVREIYAAVASDLKTRLATLQAAMDAGDGAEVARIAHAIKGGCAMVGLSGARDAAARLETSNVPVTWPAELAQLHFALTALEGMLAGNFPA